MSRSYLIWPSGLSEATADSMTPEGIKLLERLRKLEIDDRVLQVRYHRWQK